MNLNASEINEVSCVKITIIQGTNKRSEDYFPGIDVEIDTSCYKDSLDIYKSKKITGKNQYVKFPELLINNIPFSYDTSKSIQFKFKLECDIAIINNVNNINYISKHLATIETPYYIPKDRLINSMNKLDLSNKILYTTSGEVTITIYTEESLQNIPVSQMKEKNIKPSTDNLVLLCSNCHSIIHKIIQTKNKFTSIQELKDIIKENENLI